MAQEPSFFMYHSHSSPRHGRKSFNGHLMNSPPYLLIRKLYHRKRERKTKKMKRGEIWYADFGKQPGCVQGKVRPCVVIQNNTGNVHSTTVIVAPITTKQKRDMPTHVETTNEDRGISIGSIILLEQIQTIDKCQISSMVGMVSEKTMKKVDDAIRTSLALNKEGMEVKQVHEVQKTEAKTPIEIALGVDDNGMTTASKLYEFLELSPSNYSKWCKSNISENEFAEENVDFTRFVVKYESGVGIKEREDFKLTAHFAKKLSCKGNSEKAELAREYFTTVEERAKQFSLDRSQASPLLQSVAGIVDSMIRQEAEQKRQAEQLNRIEKKQEVIAETFQKADDTEDFQRWANDRIAQIAESPKFDKGQGRNKNYSLARAESYERLKQKRNCRLDERVQNAVGRALEERPDIKKTDLQKINKIYIIANDKDLRPAYELVIKEMMIYYCVA